MIFIHKFLVTRKGVVDMYINSNYSFSSFKAKVKLRDCNESKLGESLKESALSGTASSLASSAVDSMSCAATYGSTLLSSALTSSVFDGFTNSCSSLNDFKNEDDESIPY